MSGGLLIVIVLLVPGHPGHCQDRADCSPTSAYVVERLGRYSRTLSAGFHILVPFIHSVQYKHSLKETAIDIPEQICITRDNVQVSVDGILYLKVLDPQRASYGISDHRFAITQLAQTALRSEVGKIELDRTFEERTNINTQVVNELDKASEPWGIKVLRYEIKNITPPKDVLNAMEKQMRAEREKRAVILTSEGERDAAINQAEGEKQQAIKASEEKSSSRSTKLKVRRPPLRRLPPPPPKDSARWPNPRKSPAGTKPCNCEWPNNISENSVSSPKPTTPWSSRPTWPTSDRCWPWP